jgi:hypothetical protein
VYNNNTMPMQLCANIVPPNGVLTPASWASMQASLEATRAAHAQAYGAIVEWWCEVVHDDDTGAESVQMTMTFGENAS